MTGLTIPAVASVAPSAKGGVPSLLNAAAALDVPGLASFVDMMASGTAMAAAGTDAVKVPASERQEYAGSGKDLPQDDERGDASLAWLFAAMPAMQPVNAQEVTSGGEGVTNAVEAASAQGPAMSVPIGAVGNGIAAVPAVASPPMEEKEAGMVEPALRQIGMLVDAPADAPVPAIIDTGKIAASAFPADTIAPQATGAKILTADGAAPKTAVADSKVSPPISAVAANLSEVEIIVSATPMAKAPAAPGATDAAVTGDPPLTANAVMASRTEVSLLAKRDPVVIEDSAQTRTAAAPATIMPSTGAAITQADEPAAVLSAPTTAQPVVAASATVSPAPPPPQPPVEADAAPVADALPKAIPQPALAAASDAGSVPARRIVQSAVAQTPSAQPAAAAMPALFALAMTAAPAKEGKESGVVTVAGSAPATLLQQTDAAQQIAKPAEAQRQALDMNQGDWPQKMIDRIDTLRDAANAADTSIRLKPEALGRVEVAIRHQGDGAISVHFTAEQSATRTMIADAAPQLSAAAEARGIRLAGTSVDLAGSGQGSGGEQARRQFELRQNTSNRLAAREDDTQAVGDGRIA